MPEFAYKGEPPRPWMHVELVAPDGQTRLIEVVADTGNPLPLIVSADDMLHFSHLSGPGTDTNFGHLAGGFLQIRIPETGIDVTLFAYASDRVTEAIHGSSQDFEGLAGLPLLRKVEFGGNAKNFWIRSPM